MSMVETPQETMDIQDFIKADKRALGKKIPKETNKIVITQNNKPLFWFTNQKQLTQVVSRVLQDSDLAAIDRELDGKPPAEGEEIPDDGLTQAERTLLKIKDKFVFFKNLTNEEILSLVEQVKFIRHKRGEVIFEQESTGKEVYFVIKGKVEISIRGKKNEGTAKEHIKKIPLAVLSAEQIFGEMAPITGEARSARATAITDDTTLLLLNVKREIEQGNESAQAKLFQNFVQVLSEKLITMNQMVFKNR